METKVANDTRADIKSLIERTTKMAETNNLYNKFMNYAKEHKSLIG